jgi:hypothetical protein
MILSKKIEVPQTQPLPPPAYFLRVAHTSPIGGFSLSQQLIWVWLSVHGEAHHDQQGGALVRGGTSGAIFPLYFFYKGFKGKALALSLI